MNDNENKTNAPIKLPDLLPCPFCGADATCGETLSREGSVGAGFLYCTGCGASPDDYPTLEQKTQRWNTRNEADALRAEVEDRRRPVHVTKAEIDAVPDGDSAKWEPMALAICHKIESMGASDDLTELSVMANDLRQSIGAFNKYCDDHFERMCRERPDLEPLLRGTIKPNAAAGEEGADD